MQKITPFLWFEKGAEDAAAFYVSIFKDAKITATTHAAGAEMEQVSGVQQGAVLLVAFEIMGQSFNALNGGKMDGFTFSPATSFVINCETQEEVDHYWEKLGAGGKPNRCGWLTDKFGVTWQVVPTALGQLMSDPDSAKVARVSAAMIKMEKLDIAALEAAASQA